jgi:four helix bundle protein
MKNCNWKFKIDIKKRAYWYALKIIKLLDQLSKDDCACQVIGEQLLCSATGIGVNIVEEQASSSKREFIDFLHQALKSANGSKFWLGLLRDSNKASRESVDCLLTETKELANSLPAAFLA